MRLRTGIVLAMVFSAMGCASLRSPRVETPQPVEAPGKPEAHQQPGAAATSFAPIEDHRPAPAAKIPAVDPAGAPPADVKAKVPRPPTAAKNPGSSGPVSSTRPVAAPAAAGSMARVAPKSPAVDKPPAGGDSAAPAGSMQPPLDLTSLEQRLRDTHAIGIFTKLSLKNQVDDLLGAVRAYHAGQAKTPLHDLRQKYDLLLMKVLSLLQDGDPPLAASISASREALWGILSNREKFQKIQLG